MSRWKPDAKMRLTMAAITLFDEQGYQETTVAEIAGAAGLTKRTFFRYFADKREVLFDGSHELVEHWIAGIQAAPQDAAPIAAVSVGAHQGRRVVRRPAFFRQDAIPDHRGQPGSAGA